MALGKYFKREESTPVAEPPASNLGDIEKARPPSYADGDHHEAQVPIDPAIEKRVIRKLDMNVVPLVMALCTSPQTLLFDDELANDVASLDLLAFLDRSNIGYVSLFYLWLFSPSNIHI
jgi:hypothetical protein